MADNYLENKMEEHRRSPAGALPRRYSPLGQRRGTASFSFGERNIIVTGCESAPELAAAVIKALGETGSHVSFLWEDISRGSRLAQTTATRHFPWPDARKEDVRHAMGNVDFEVTVSENRILLAYDDKSTLLTGSDTAAMATAAVYALLPLSRQIAFREINLEEGTANIITKD